MNERIEAANNFIRIIASNGRKFFAFHHPDGIEIARFRRSESGHIWFLNEWKRNWIYVSKYGSWRGFHHGGTLHSLVAALVEFIRSGKQLRPEWFDAKHWAYYDEAMNIVVTEGQALGVVSESKQ